VPGRNIDAQNPPDTGQDRPAGKQDVLIDGSPPETQQAAALLSAASHSGL
jgi:hypothetical protein